MFRYRIIFSLLVIFCHSAAFAMTEEELSLQRVQDRVNSLEKNLSTMQQEFYRSSGKGKKQQVADTSEFVGMDEEKIRSFNGKIEELDHKINTLAAKLDKIIADIDFRISAIEKKVNEANNKANEEKTEEAKKQEDSSNSDEKGDNQQDKQNQEKSADSKELVTENKVQENKPSETKVVENKEQKSNDSKTDNKKNSSADQYERALELLRANKYAEAEKVLKEFIKNNKDTELASNSYYWLGETFYSRDNFQQAAVQFLKGYQDYQKGSKAPDNLLKLAMSLRKLKKDKEACATLEKLKKEYPNADKDLLAKVYTERQEIKCK